MADIDIIQLENMIRHPDKTGKNIPLTSGGGSSWKPEREQRTSFGGGLREELLKKVLKGCIESYLKAWENPQKNFIIIISKSEMEDMNMPSMTKDGTLRSAGAIACIL